MPWLYFPAPASQTPSPLPRSSGTPPTIQPSIPVHSTSGPSRLKQEDQVSILPKSYEEVKSLAILHSAHSLIGLWLIESVAYCHQTLLVPLK
jgi:hypothetical protein